MDEEQRLLQRAHQLDEAALATIFDTHYRAVYRYILLHSRHQETAEDLTARVFQKLLEALHRGRGPTRNLKGWLLRVAHRQVIDEVRRAKHRQHDELPEGLPASGMAVEEGVHLSLMNNQVQAALIDLTPKQRAVIILRYLQGLEPAEVAEVLHLTTGAVKSLQHRALNALRKRLGEEHPAGGGMEII